MAVEPEVVGDHDAPPLPDKPDSGPRPGGDKETKVDAKAVRDYEAEIAQLRQQVTEKDQVALHWYNKAQGVTAPRDDDDDEGQPAKPAKAASPPDDDDETPDKFVDKLATLGPKAIDELLAKRGFMSAQKVQELVTGAVNGAVGKITREAQLYAMYPDLRDENSELFKETQKDFKEMVSLDKSLAKNPAAVQIAAKTAATRLKAAAEIAEAKKPKETDAERRARAAAAGGDLGRQGGAEFQDEVPGQLTDLQKHMLERFSAAGGGPDIDPEKLMKRMQRGVRMQFVPGRDAQGRFQ